MAKTEYTNLSISKDALKRLRSMQAKRYPELRPRAFIDKVVSFFEKSTCPECGEPIKFKRCSCKATELL